MARIIQVILPLVCVVLAEAQLHLPFFDIPGLSHPARPISDGPREDWPSHENVGYDSGYGAWIPHFGNPDAHQFSSESHERDKSDEDFDPFYHRDPHYHDDDWDHMPGIHNVFNIPNPSHNHHRHLPSHKVNNPDEKPKQDHNDGANVHNHEDKPKNDEKPTDQDNGPKLNEANIPDVKNNSDISPPKTNDIKKEDDKKGKDDKQDVGVDKKKDYLLVGQGGNGNDVYLLHENNPNPYAGITSNPNQPGNNIMYVPYNPGQSNNPVYQVINAQPSNMPMSQDKIGVSNGYNNAASNPGQPTMNMNAGNQNPGYVTIYSNGQLIQIPGVVVNSSPNNVPSNQVQGTNYIIANTVPNNMQSAPAIQNPGTNVIYATLPNQASNGPIYVQIPNCMHTMSNGCSSGTVAQNPVNNGMSNNGLPSNVIMYQPNSNTISQPAVYPNGVSNGYVQPNMVTSPGQGTIAVASPNQNNPVYNNQNGQYQPAVELPVNTGSSGYNQPIVSNPGQGQNAPNQGGMISNGNIPIQTAVQLPVSDNNNGYNQPLTSQKQQVNTPNQGGMINNQNMPLQPAVEMPVNSGMPGYNQPMAPNQGQGLNGPNQGATVNNQNMPLQPAVDMPVNSGIPGYNQPMASNQGQGLNVPNQGAMTNNQNMPLQPAVEIPITNGYNDHPLVTNPSPRVNVENRGEMPSNQNSPAQPAVSASSDSNGYSQPPQVLSQGDQATNAVGNTPSNDVVISQPDNTPSLATSLVLDSNNLSSLGAQPAIMISGFKDKKDKKKSKDKKEKKAKGKKKDKKPKEADTEADTPKVPEPFTNKKI